MTVLSTRTTSNAIAAKTVCIKHCDRSLKSGMSLERPRGVRTCPNRDRDRDSDRRQSRQYTSATRERTAEQDRRYFGWWGESITLGQGSFGRDEDSDDEDSQRRRSRRSGFEAEREPHRDDDNEEEDGDQDDDETASVAATDGSSNAARSSEIVARPFRSHRPHESDVSAMDLEERANLQALAASNRASDGASVYERQSTPEPSRGKATRDFARRRDPPRRDPRGDPRRRTVHYRDEALRSRWSPETECDPEAREPEGEKSNGDLSSEY